MLYRVSIACKNRSRGKEFRKALNKKNVQANIIASRKNITHELVRQGADMFIISLSLLPGPHFQTLELLNELPENPSVIVLSDSNDPLQHAKYLGKGCDAVLYDSLPFSQLLEAVEAVIEKKLEIQNEIIKNTQTISGPRLSDFVSSSSSMQAFMKLVYKVVKSESSLLVLGETGVGKERLARAIHEESPRAAGPFIPVNCAALPDNLLESELFGHEQGAFTGAVRTRRGAFELGHGGTVFLDEIGEMPLYLQVKLLRAIQEKEFTRVGGEIPVKVDVRIMAATNRDLVSAVEENEFRKDLFYRISVITLNIPPLRERKEDIPELVRSYINYLSPRMGKHPLTVENKAMKILREYSYPGNVRELINIVERALLLSTGETITVEDLPEGIEQKQTVEHPDIEYTDRIAGGKEQVNENCMDMTWKELRENILHRHEKIYFETLLHKTHGRIKDAAALAGMDPRSVHEKMKRHDLRKEDFKIS